jgi:hypothetical protein
MTLLGSHGLRSGNIFKSASGGANVGLTSGAENATMMGLIHLVLFIMKLHLFEYMAVRSNHYAYEEWVVPKDRMSPNAQFYLPCF